MDKSDNLLQVPADTNFKKTHKDSCESTSATVPNIDQRCNPTSQSGQPTSPTHCSHAISQPATHWTEEGYHLSVKKGKMVAVNQSKVIQHAIACSSNPQVAPFPAPAGDWQLSNWEKTYDEGIYKCQNTQLTRSQGVRIPHEADLKIYDKEPGKTKSLQWQQQFLQHHHLPRELQYQPKLQSCPPKNHKRQKKDYLREHLSHSDFYCNIQQKPDESIELSANVLPASSAGGVKAIVYQENGQMSNCNEGMEAAGEPFGNPMGKNIMIFFYLLSSISFLMFK
ncbi:unnamed protein product [Protopolystoma xenopodis]|uniref:Uncharacterized protein n=1 Tax=Protopolystoma xenopodis TaxID=117903 RepID=A0A3S5AME3_9PLAT|nr:unnamed protein product [Protopolystoma xenopodis]